MVAHTLLHKAHELVAGLDKFTSHLSTIFISSECETTYGIGYIAPGFDDRVDVAGALKVLGVVVTVADAEGANDSAELGHLDGLASNVAGNLGHARAELADGARFYFVFLPVLTMVREHDVERASAALTLEVRVLNGVRKDSLFASHSWL